MIYPATKKYIDIAIHSLLKGEVIVYPTDTLYGFGVDATNTDAIKKIKSNKRTQPTLKHYFRINKSNSIFC